MVDYFSGEFEVGAGVLHWWLYRDLVPAGWQFKIGCWMNDLVEDTEVLEAVGDVEQPGSGFPVEDFGEFVLNYFEVNASEVPQIVEHIELSIGSEAFDEDEDEVEDEDEDDEHYWDASEVVRNLAWAEANAGLFVLRGGSDAFCEYACAGLVSRGRGKSEEEVAVGSGFLYGSQVKRFVNSRSADEFALLGDYLSQVGVALSEGLVDDEELFEELDRGEVEGLGVGAAVVPAEVVRVWIAALALARSWWVEVPDGS